MYNTRKVKGVSNLRLASAGETIMKDAGPAKAP